MAGAVSARSPANIAAWVNERLKTTPLAIEQWRTAEANCSRVRRRQQDRADKQQDPADKQKASFYPTDPSVLLIEAAAGHPAETAQGPAYSPPSLPEMKLALADEVAIASKAP